MSLIATASTVRSRGDPFSLDERTIDLVRTQLSRILDSRGFRRSDRMIRFLRFAVEQMIQRREQVLKEHLIGVEVFDRKPSYDAGADPIVRVEARRLRAKLKGYYEEEGCNDPIWIEFPVGGYAPIFRWSDSPTPSPEPGSASRSRGKAIAVLPFVNFSADRGNEYFSDGLTEELINALTRLKGMCVVARTSAFQFKGKAYDIRKLGEQLNVQTVLEGSVRKADKRLRIAVQLIDVQDGYHLWSETYDREMKDVFSLQEEISHSIVAALKPRLVSDTGTFCFRRSGENLEAYHLYLKGRFHCSKRTEEGIHKSIEYYQRAIQTSPDYASAFAGLAEAFSLLGHKGLSLPKEVMPKAKAAALRALEMDDQVADAHVSLGFVKSTYDWEWEEAGRHYERALEINPGNAEAHHWYGSDYLTPLGRLDEAWSEMQQAQFLDPLSLVINSAMGFVLISKRQYDEAIEHYKRLFELDPHYYRIHTGLGRAYAGKGMLEEALAHFRKARSSSGDIPYVTGILAHCHALMGEDKEARKLLAELLNLSKKRYVPSTTLALIYAGLNELDGAFEWLEMAFRKREGPLVYINVYLTYDCLRSDPRFCSLVRRIGL